MSTDAQAGEKPCITEKVEEPNPVVETDEGTQNTKEKLAAEEAKLRSKFPQGAMAGHSLFLQKRLAKGQKFFDSGDYQMAKQKQTKSRMPPLLAQPTGDAIPTPETVPVRKTSIIQHNKLTAS